MNAFTFRADASRLVLRLPLVGLALLAAGAALGIAAGSWQSVDLLVVATLAFAYICCWAARTRLVLDETGVMLSTLLSTWHAPWASIASISVTSFLTPTHRGGVGAGVTLHLSDRASRSIPDVFSVGRGELAHKLARYRLNLRNEAS